MAHPFELSYEIEVDASPKEVWEAIATGPGVDSWFMGRNEIEPRARPRGAAAPPPRGRPPSPGRGGRGPAPPPDGRRSTKACPRATRCTSTSYAST